MRTFRFNMRGKKVGKMRVIHFFLAFASLTVTVSNFIFVFNGFVHLKMGNKKWYNKLPRESLYTTYFFKCTNSNGRTMTMMIGAKFQFHMFSAKLYCSAERPTGRPFCWPSEMSVRVRVCTPYNGAYSGIYWTNTSSIKWNNEWTNEWTN